MKRTLPLFLLLALTGACLTLHHTPPDQWPKPLVVEPTPTPTPEPPTPQAEPTPTPTPIPRPVVLIRVCDPAGSAIPGASILVSGAGSGTTDAAGALELTVSPSLLQSHLYVTAPTYVAHDQHLDIDGHDLRVDVTLARAIPVVTERLRTDGAVFRAPDGRIWKWHGASAFLLLKKQLDGEAAAVDAFLHWAHSNDINTLRVLGMEAWAGRSLIPSAYGERYWTALEDLCTLAAEHGLRLELTALADAQTVLPAVSAQQAFVARAASVLARHPNTFLEVGNEWPKNGFDPANFPRAYPGVLTSRGSGLADDPPPVPVGDYSVFHAPRDAEWPRKAKNSVDIGLLGWEGFPATNRPVVEDEPMGIGRNSDARSLVAADFFDFFAVADLYGAGGTVHGDFGIDVRIPDAQEQACVDAIRQAWAMARPEAQLGHYTRGGLDDSPLVHDDATALRSFCMIRGNAADCVVVRKGYAGDPVSRAGWRVTSVKGTGRNVVQLTK